MEKILIDIAGVFTELIMFHMLFVSTYPKIRRNKSKLKFAIVSFFTFCIMMFLSILPLTLVLRIILVWLTVFLFSIPFPGTWYQKFLIAFLPVSINCCMEIMAGAIQISLFGANIAWMPISTRQYAQGVLLSKALSFIVILFLTKTGCQYLAEISTRILSLMTFILFISTVLVYNLFSLLSLSADPLLHQQFLLICISIVSINIIIFYIIHYINEKEKENYEYLQTQNSLQNEKILFAELAKKNERLNILSHNLHNKLLAIVAYAQQENYKKIITTIQTLDEEILLNKVYLTGCPELDAMLFFKFETAKANNIKVIQTLTATSFHIDIFDLNTIIGNLLDNAIENCQTNNHNEKFIKCAITNRKTFLFITIENTINRKIEINSENSILTTKKDGLFHGIGLKSIKQLVKKYNGNFILESSNIIFSAQIMLLNTKDPINSL